MRAFVSFAVGLVAVLVALVTVPLLWVSENVAKEDGYVDLSSRLVTDAELQAALAGYLADDFVQRGVLPTSLQETAAGLMTAAAKRATDEPGFLDAWEDTQRGVHQSAFSDDEGAVTVRVAPLADLVTQRVADELPVSLRVPENLTIPLGTEADRAHLRWIERSQTFALLGLMIVLATSATALLAARRKTIGLAGLGLGALVVAGVLRVATEAVTPRLVDRVEGTTEFSRTIQKLLIDRASQSLAGWLGWIAVCGVAALVLGLIGRAATRRPQT